VLKNLCENAGPGQAPSAL
jgi:hypothetical protein